MTIPPDIQDEYTSINSIYGAETLAYISATTSGTQKLDLTLPDRSVSLRLVFPKDYPQQSPSIERITHVSEELPKGFGDKVVNLARTILADLPAGDVVVYELVEALEARIAVELEEDGPRDSTQEDEDAVEDTVNGSSFSYIPNWILSEPLQSHKSTFLARACSVSAVTEAQAAVSYLLTTDKRAAKATHNMWAYRIRGSGNKSEVIYADADDDGEDGAGMKLAALLQSMGAWNVLVVVSRWYGGIKLGPERWRLIGSVGREAIVRSGQAGIWKVEKS